MFLLLGISFLAVTTISAQGLLCESSEPFCTGSIYTFPAGTTGSAQPGAYYGCLSTQPAPAWYHMLIDNPGAITIYMYSTPLVDIDFICWGPFADPYNPCVEGLTANTVVDCSYSPNPTEYCDIPNGQTGQYYILLITNYSQQPCEITFSQTGGSGSTDCTILPPPVSNNGPLCVGETLNLYAETVPNASYWWSGPAGFLSAQQNPVIPNVTSANAGDYSCVITVNGQSSDPAITSVIIYNLPTAELISDDTIVCPNDQAYAIFQFTGWGPFKITYNDGAGTYVATGLYGPKDTVFLTPTQPTTYTFTKCEDLHCERQLLFMQMEADTYEATSGVMTGSGTICAGQPADLEFNLTGTPPWSITYTINGGNPQTTLANSSPYILQVYPTTTTTYAFSALEDINCDGEVSGEAVIHVDPSPTANAGSDQSIPYGTSTALYGLVSGGSGNYEYAWEPAAKLVNPNIQNPTTLNLTETTVFTLTATDTEGGCFNNDNLQVTVTGGPLGCFPAANPSVVCDGESTQLFTMATGGSGNYTYMWSSNPPGFSSYIADPVVIPEQTTVYSVVVNDGYNVYSGNVTVTVRPNPVPEAGNDIVIAHGTNTTLQGTASGGSGNYSYHWEPVDKLINPNVANPQTINLYSTTLFTLHVTDVTTGCQEELPDQMAVVISGDALGTNPAASNDQICLGESTQLFALAGGGSGSYNYSWSSNNGFSSTEQNPWVNPAAPGSFIYTCSVNDGFNTASGSVGITVLDVPQINFGFADTIICVYDSIILDAGNPGSYYMWSNGSTQRTIKIATTGIGFDVQTPSVIVTNQAGCESEKSATIIFDFSSCSGINDNLASDLYAVYPNPGNGSFTLTIKPGYESAVYSVRNILGQCVYGPVNSMEDQDKGDVKIDLGPVPAGVYFIEVRLKNSVSGVSKYVVRN